MTLLIKYRVVLDTNVFISGLLYGGNCEKILELFEKDRIKLLISPKTHAELLIKLKEFNLADEFIEKHNILIQAKAIKILPKKKVKLSRDPKDNMFLELCLAGNGDYLISGDRDLIDLKSFKNTQIITPKEFLDIVT